MQVERGAFVAIRGYPSGRRVSNAWGIYLFVWNNVPKGMVIPHVTVDWDIDGESRGPSGLAQEEDPASD